MIRLEGVAFSYHPGSDGAVQALRDVHLSVGRGEFVAVVGANGSGKSTLAKHLNALLLPTSGAVRIAGLDTSDAENLWEIRRRVGMVFQNPDNQLVATTVEEDVAFGPENLGLPRPEIVRRVKEALATVGMQDQRHRSPHHLSGGQKQRVAIAGILAMRPEVLVMDEPTAMLDPRGRRDVLETALRLNREAGITLVYITHFMEETVAAERVAVMAEGRVLEVAPPEEIFRSHGLLASAELQPPPAVQLADALRRRGVAVPGEAHTCDGLVEALCRLRSSA